MARIVHGSGLAWMLAVCCALAPKPCEARMPSPSAGAKADAREPARVVFPAQERREEDVGTAAQARFSVEEARIEEARLALKSSDPATAREKLVMAVDALLAQPDTQRDAAWADVLDDAGRVAWAARDVRTAQRAWILVLEVRSVTLQDEHPDVTRTRQNLANTMYALGDLEGARALQEKVLDVRLRTLPDEHPDIQSARRNLAGTMRALGDLQGARALFDKVLEVSLRTLPEDHPDLQSAKLNLADTIRQLGDLQGALVLLRGVLDARSRTLHDDHPDLQSARQALAAVLNELGDRDGARSLQEKVLEVRQRTLPDDHPDLQAARANLAMSIGALGDLRGARALEEKVLEVRLRTLPEEHPSVQRARENLATTIYLLGDVQGARSIFEDVMVARARTLSDEHPDLQRSRLNLAGALYSLGDPEGARLLLEKVVEVRTRTLPKDHPGLQLARLNLAATMEELGDIEAARGVFEDVLDARSRTLPDDHPDLQDVRLRLASVLDALGDSPGARALFENVLEVRSRSLPDDHPDLQAARQGLASMLKSLGDLAEASALQQKVLDVRTRTLPDEHSDLQGARQGMALLYKARGDLEGALVLEEKVLQVRTRTLPDAHPDLLAAQQNLAITKLALGDLQGARVLQEESLEAFSRTLSELHPHVQAARLNLARTLVLENVRTAIVAADGEVTGAVGDQRYHGMLVALVLANVRAAQQVLLEATPREAESRCSALAKSLDVPISVALGVGGITPAHQVNAPCFTLSETTRGAALASARVMRVASASPDYGLLRKQLAAGSKSLADLAALGTSSAEFRVARERREALERELVALGRELGGAPLATVEFDPQALAASLGAGDVLVAYRRYERWRVTVPEAKDGVAPAVPVGSSEPSLCAFVLRRSASDVERSTRSAHAEPQLALVDLGPIAPVEDAVRAWREALGTASGRGLATPETSGTADVDARGAAIRRLVFDPLRVALGDAQRVIVVPDDVLHLVPFDVLPSRDGEREMLGDRLRIETRATAVELTATVPRTQGTGELLAVGGVAFDEIEPSTQFAALLRGGSFGGFAPLPATKEEVESLAASFAAQDGSSEVALLRGEEATRERFLELAPRARWLHVATHGWYASESIRSWADPEPLDKLSGLGMRESGEEQVRGMSPMLLCGLALAGANRPEDAVGRAPGLLTAAEIAALDLSGCELVVLSACDTNAGEHKAGQGVASLQMALQMAGARSVITSLWKVPDEATKELMLDFYRRMWIEKKPKGQALQEAKYALRDARDADGRARYGLRDWGAWLLTGEPD